MATKIYQIYLELQDSEPKIWRRLLVPSDVLLSDLHKIIQTAMGWTNSHLHQFIKDGNFYEPPAPVDMGYESYGDDYTGIKLDKLLLKKNDTIMYEYDFGDSWEHEVKLEEILSEDKDIRLPKCIAGVMACPPEDCGGVWGFQEFREIMKDPSHPEHEEYINWHGGKFDPEAFDAEEVNEMLQEKNYGVFEW